MQDESPIERSERKLARSRAAGRRLSAGQTIDQSAGAEKWHCDGSSSLSQRGTAPDIARFGQPLLTIANLLSINESTLKRFPWNCLQYARTNTASQLTSTKGDVDLELARILFLMTDTTTASEQHSSTAPATTTSFTSTKTLATIVAVLAIILASFAPIRNTLSKAFNTPTIRNMATTSPALKVTKRTWSARGHADHDWLYTFHTFSFASYFDPKHESFGPLRVINEDRVKPGTGFGAHSHSEFLIFSYIVNGTLEHKDSMGNLENLKRGEVQFTSAGTGIRHSEYNRNRDDEVHFLQIWAKPNKRGLKPHYETKKFSDEQKKDKLVRIMEYTDRLGDNKDAIGLQADLSMDASILSPGQKVTHDVVAEGPRKLFVQHIMTKRAQPKEGGAKIKVGDVVLGEGDGAYVDGVSGPGKIEVESVGEKPAEFLLFDMGPEEA